MDTSNKKSGPQMIGHNLENSIKLCPHAIMLYFNAFCSAVKLPLKINTICQDAIQKVFSSCFLLKLSILVNINTNWKLIPGRDHKRLKQ